VGYYFFIFLPDHKEASRLDALEWRAHLEQQARIEAVYQDEQKRWQYREDLIKEINICLEREKEIYNEYVRAWDAKCRSLKLPENSPLPKYAREKIDERYKKKTQENDNKMNWFKDRFYKAGGRFR